MADTIYMVTDDIIRNEVAACIETAPEGLYLDPPTVIDFVCDQIAGRMEPARADFVNWPAVERMAEACIVPPTPWLGW